MNGKYLIINAGSSSLKVSLYDMPETKEIVNIYFERIGSQDSFYTLKCNGQKTKKSRVIANHMEALQTMLAELKDNQFISDISDVKGVGHRVVHGGEFYAESVIIDGDVLNKVKSLTPLVPLHHPSEIAVVENLQSIMPDVPQVAVFDTAFHQTMPEENYMYAVPFDWYKENGVRRYGFHGTSHKYITEAMQKSLHKDDVNLIICHIGSGASMCCVKDGKSHNTTMGLTPVEGLVMGTRCGDIDSSIVEYICRERNLSVEEVTTMLSKHSGLLGLAGKNDYRDIEALANNGDEKAKLAIKMLRNSIAKYIAQYYVELEGNVDAIVFTAGIGENSMALRADVIDVLSKALDVKLDAKANDNIASFKENQTGTITTPDSKVKVMVVPTDEEYMILKDTYDLSEKAKNQGQQPVFKRKTKQGE